jgi:hypothetical protein
MGRSLKLAIGGLLMSFVMQSICFAQQPTPAPAPGGVAAPGSATITKSGSVVVISPPAEDLTTTAAVDQFQDGISKGTPTSSGPAPQNPVRDRGILNYTNKGNVPWEGFRIEIAGDNLDTLLEGLRSATIKHGWGAASGWAFKNEKGIDRQNKGAKFLISARTTPKQVIVKPNENVQIQVDMGCFPALKVTPVGCKYHLSVKPIP